MIVFLVGYMGCGKTTIGRRLARRLGYDFADTDDRIEKQEGADVCDIFHYAGEEYFRKAERGMLEQLPLFRTAQLPVGFQAGSFQGAVFRPVPFAARGYLHQPGTCYGRDGEGDPRRKAVAFARGFGGDLSGGHAFARRRNPSFQGGGFHAGARGGR